MVLGKPGDYQAQPCRSVLPLPDDVCVPWEVAEGLTPWHPSLFAFNRGEDLLAERALELAQRLVPRVSAMNGRRGWEGCWCEIS